jgi:hypothetical protein
MAEAERAEGTQLYASDKPSRPHIGARTVAAISGTTSLEMHAVGDRPRRVPLEHAPSIASRNPLQVCKKPTRIEIVEI